MVECDHCGESFDNEFAYVEHLEAAHEDEMSRIDRRRIESVGDDGTSGNVRTYVVYAVAGALVLALVSFGLSTLLDDSGGEYGLESDPSHPALDDVEQFDSNGREHVSSGTALDYPREPPLSGDHYGSGFTQAGFFEERPDFGNIVHSLEHGAVVIYYDPDALSDTAEEDLRGWAQEYTDNFASVIVAPHPADDPPAAYVLTAWQHRLQLSEYDRPAVKAFLGEYLGRGPERPVR